MVVFFIFLVGNVGGPLMPLGDPPLFLRLLHGASLFDLIREEESPQKRMIGYDR